MADKTGQITGGAIRFMERMKTGDYEHREVSTELSFGVHENQDHRDLLDQVADEAQRTTLRLLGKPTTAKGGAGRAVRPPAVIKPAETPPKPAADPAAMEEPVAPLDSSVGAGTISVPSAGTSDPSAIEEPSNVIPLGNTVAPSVSVPSPGPSVPAGVSDPSAIVEPGDEWTAARDITDKDLTDTITRANAGLITTHKEKGPMMIRELIAKYLPPGKPAREIPQDQRQKFLDDLAKLK